MTYQPLQYSTGYGNLAQTNQIIINSTIGIAHRQRFDANPGPDPVPKRPFNSDVKQETKTA
jgi:hypothetical protein